MNNAKTYTTQKEKEEKEESMRVVGFMALHYGLDYIQYAIESIIDFVDVLHIAYSPVGSHGATTPVPCPESERDLRALAHKAAAGKLVWHYGTWPHEGAQRDMIYEWAPDADIIVVCDSDEVWATHQLIHGIRTVQETKARNYRVPMVHYWRSFRRCFTKDRSFPVRLINPRITSDDEWYLSETWGYINHFGYAIKPDLMRYKWLIHGHRAEYRQGWWENVYMNKTCQQDLHPVGNDSWNYEIVEQLDYMPNGRKTHPFQKRR